MAKAHFDDKKGGINAKYIVIFVSKILTCVFI